MDSKQRRRAEMAGVLARKEAKGWTYEVASIKTGIPVSTLAFWKRRLREESSEQPADASAFLELEPVAEPLQVDNTAVEVRTATGHRVVVSPGFDAATLRRLLDVLAC